MEPSNITWHIVCISDTHRQDISFRRKWVTIFHYKGNKFDSTGSLVNSNIAGDQKSLDGILGRVVWVVIKLYKR